jgi:hypothetical protein
LRNRIAAGAALFLVVGGGAAVLRAQQPKPSPEPPRFPEAPPSARLWRSLTTGKEYRVWMSGSQLYAEWVNIPPASAAQGASIRIECRRTNGRYIGTAQNHLPCDTTENGKRVTNFCRVISKIEFNPPEASRMTGRTETAHRFDCATCTLLETRWINFEWVPKPPAPVGSIR